MKDSVDELWIGAAGTPVKERFEAYVNPLMNTFGR
jgi:hypothetical protein